MAGQALEYETRKENYKYALQRHDVVHLSRILGISSGVAAFELITSVDQMGEVIANCAQSGIRNLNLILHLSENHWVTLVMRILKQNPLAYYYDLLCQNIPDNYSRELALWNITTVQEFRDSHQTVEDHDCCIVAIHVGIKIREYVGMGKTSVEIRTMVEAIRWSADDLKDKRLYFAGLLEADQVRRKYVDSLLVIGNTPETYESDVGLKSSLHGNIYQLKLIMLFIKRGLDNGCTFRIASEWSKAEKFDDLVFKRVGKDGALKYTFLQAKHKQDQSKLISVNDLFMDADGEFSLQKYFHSYCKMKCKDEFKAGTNNKFVLCTNIDVDSDHLKSVGIIIQEQKGRHDIFNVGVMRRPKCYRFVTIPADRKQVFHQVLDCNRLAKSVADCIMEGKDFTLRDPIFKTYHLALTNEVFDKSKRKFQNGFLDSQISDGRKCFREALLQMLSRGKRKKGTDGFTLDTLKTVQLKLSEPFGKRQTQFKHTTELAKRLADIARNAQQDVQINRKDEPLIEENVAMLAEHVLVFEDELLRFKEQLFLRKPPDHTNVQHFIDELNKHLNQDVRKSVRFAIEYFPKLTLPDDSNRNIDQDVDAFFEHFVLAVNQPDEKELSLIINEELGKEYNLLKGDIVGSPFLESVLDWMKTKRGEFFDEDRGKSFFVDATNQLCRLILIGETEANQERLDGYGIVFQTDLDLATCLTLPDKVLTVECEHDTTLGAIRVRAALKQSDGYGPRDSLVFTTLDFLLRLPLQVRQACKLKGRYLLVIECLLANEEQRYESDRLLKNLISECDCGEKKKIFLIAVRGSAFSEYSTASATIRPGMAFGDLDDNTRDKLLKKEITFQGSRLPLGKLLDKESGHLVDSETLSKLVHTNGEEICIGKKPPSLEKIKPYYVERKFYSRRYLHLHDLKQVTFGLILISDMNPGELVRLVPENSACSFQDCLADPEQDGPIRFVVSETGKGKENFKALCGVYSNTRSIHWFRERDGILVWVDSSGEVAQLRLFLCSNDEPFVEHQVRKGESNKNIIIISASPGMGKTTILTHLIEKEKEEETCLWVIKVNLVDCIPFFNSSPKYDEKDMLDFISSMEKFNSPLEFQFLKYCLGNKGKIVLLFDGFDEISPNYTDKAIRLIAYFEATKVKTIWITTRPQMQAQLEDTFNSLSYSMAAFSTEDQEMFLMNFWKEKLQLEVVDKNVSKKFIHKLMSSFTSSAMDKDNNYMDVPLQVQMLAEVFLSEYQSYITCPSETSLDNLPKKLDVYDIYESFVGIKLNIFHSEKTKSDNTLPAAEFKSRIFEKKVLKVHGKLALQLLFKDELEHIMDIEEFDQTNLARVGLFDTVKNQFEHRTFAEYFVADYLGNIVLQKELEKLPPVCMLLEEVLFEEHNDMIRHFFDLKITKGYLVHAECINGTIDDLMDEADFSAKDKLGRIPLHLAAAYGNTKTVNKLLEHDGTSIQSVDIFQKKPVVYAVLSKDGALIRLLISLESDTGELVPTLKNTMRVAVQRRTTDIVKLLLEYLKPADQQDVLSESLLYAIERRDAGMERALLYNASKSQQEQILQAHNYQVFQKALLKNHGESFTSLFHYCIPRQQDEVFEVLDYNKAFKDSIERWDTDMLSTLLFYANSAQKLELLSRTDDVGLFQKALQTRNTNIVRNVLKSYDKQKQARLFCDGTLQLFKDELRGSACDFVDALLQDACKPIQDCLLDASIDVYEEDKEQVDIEMTEVLLRHASEANRHRILSCLNCIDSFGESVDMEDWERAIVLLHAGSNRQRCAMLNSVNLEEVFKMVVRNCESEMVTVLFKCSDDQQKSRMWDAIDYVRTFQWAVGTIDDGYDQTLLIRALLDAADEGRRQEMLASINCVQLFKRAVELHDSVTTEWLLEFSSPQTKSQLMESVNVLEAFQVALGIPDGHRARVFLKYASPDLRRTLIDDANVTSKFEEALSLHDINTVSTLLDYASEAQRVVLVNHIDFERQFKVALQIPDAYRAEVFLKYASPEQRLLLYANIDCISAFKHAHEMQNETLMRVLLQYATSEKQTELRNSVLE